MTLARSLRGISVALFAGLFALNALAQSDNPPLWKVNGTLYLFGSFHLLPPDVNWRTPAVARALENAATIVLETDTEGGNGENAVQPLVVKHGLLPPGQTLRGILPAKANSDLERVAGELQVPPASLDTMRPWLAGMVLAVQFMINRGYDPAKGVEQQVAAWGRQNGKSFATLESLESQIRIFADLSRDEEISLLSVSLRQIREMPGALGEILVAYRKGDLAALERLLNSGFDGQPALRRRIFGERHRQWLPRLEKMIAGGQPQIVIVGAAHMVGPDGIVAMLRARGYKVEGP